MSSIDLDVSDLRRLQADIETAGPRVGAKVAKATRTSARRMESRAEAASPHGRTGALAAGWEAWVAGDGRSTAITGGIVNRTRQAFFQEHGTSRHPAQPTAAPVLAAEAPVFVAALEDALGGMLDA